MDLQELRKQIDAIDTQVVNLLNQRAGIARKVGDIKKQKNAEQLYDPVREARLMDKLRGLTQGPLTAQHIEHIYREVISACLSLEQAQRIAYLGPEGTFTQIAARNHFGSSAEFVACTSIADCFDMVERQQAGYCVVPIENSTEGVISQTIELLATGNLRIIGEQELLVEHCLLARSGVQLDQVETVYGHQQALAQCQHWLREHLGKASLKAVTSNARGAQLAAQSQGCAAVASKMSAEIYSLAVLTEHIEDITGNKTRFVVIGNFDVAATGKDKTAMIFATPHKPGGLFHALKHFNDYGIDLTRLESRPLQTSSWDYSFFIEFHGHISDEQVTSMLESLRQDTRFIKFLGSFPRPTEVQT